MDNMVVHIAMRGLKTMGLVFLTFLFLFSVFSTAVPVIRAEESKSIVYDVVSSTRITKVAYYVQEFQGRENLFFEVELKNISIQPKRFKLIIFIHNGPSAAYFYPRTGEPAVLKPGETYVQPLPLVPFSELPLGFTIKVEEL